MATKSLSPPLVESGATLAQVKQYKQWHDKAYEHQVAHAKASTRDEIWALALPALIGMLGVFSGTVWTVDLAGAGVPTDVIKWTSAIAGFAVAVLVALSKAIDFASRSKQHHAASKRFAKTKEQLETWLGSGKLVHGLSNAEAHTVAAEYDAALYPSDPLNVSSWLLSRGRRRAKRAHWAEELLR